MPLSVDTSRSMYSLASTGSPRGMGGSWPLRCRSGLGGADALREVPHAHVRVDQQDLPVLLRCGVRDLQRGGGLAVARPDARHCDRLSADSGQLVLHRGDDEVIGVLEGRVELRRRDRFARRHLRGAQPWHLAEQRRFEDPGRFAPALGALVACCRPPRPRRRARAGPATRPAPRPAWAWAATGRWVARPARSTPPRRRTPPPGR